MNANVTKKDAAASLCGCSPAQLLGFREYENGSIAVIAPSGQKHVYSAEKIDAQLSVMREEAKKSKVEEREASEKGDLKINPRGGDEIGSQKPGKSKPSSQKHGRKPQKKKAICVHQRPSASYQLPRGGSSPAKKGNGGKAV